MSNSQIHPTILAAIAPWVPAEKGPTTKEYITALADLLVRDMSLNELQHLVKELMLEYLGSQTREEILKTLAISYPETLRELQK